MTQLPLNIKVIIGSVREGRFGDKAATWIAGELAKEADVNVEVLDLRDYQMPFFNESVSPAYKTAPYTHEAVVRFTAKIAEGDAFVLVTPEYNHGPSAVLKNALDWVYQEWNRKAVAFVAYGSVGGARAVEQLRLSAIELQMASARNAVHFNGEQYFPALFGQTPVEELFNTIGAKAAPAMINELLWWGRALKASRNS